MDKVQANDFRHRAGSAIPEVAMHGIAHHFPQFLDGFSLGGDGVTESRGDKTAIVFVYFKDDLAHGDTITPKQTVMQV